MKDLTPLIALIKEEGQDLSEKLLALRQGFYRTLGPDFSPVTDLDKMFIAMVLYERGNLKKAVEIFKEVVRNSPWDTIAKRMLLDLMSDLKTLGM